MCSLPFRCCNSVPCVRVCVPRDRRGMRLYYCDSGVVQFAGELAVFSRRPLRLFRAGIVSVHCSQRCYLGAWWEETGVTESTLLESVLRL